MYLHIILCYASSEATVFVSLLLLVWNWNGMRNNDFSWFKVKPLESLGLSLEHLLPTSSFFLFPEMSAIEASNQSTHFLRWIWVDQWMNESHIDTYNYLQRFVYPPLMNNFSSYLRTLPSSFRIIQSYRSPHQIKSNQMQINSSWSVVVLCWAATTKRRRKKKKKKITLLINWKMKVTSFHSQGRFHFRFRIFNKNL